MSEKVLIAGGSGLLGRQLTARLQSKGYQVAWLSRSHRGNAPCEVFTWDVGSGMVEEAAWEQVDHVINLAGEPVVGPRWTNKRKAVLESSRIGSNRLLSNEIVRLGLSLKTVMVSSGIGIYGMNPREEAATENDRAGDDYLARLCVKWEYAAEQIKSTRARLVVLRTGVVLTEKGGALMPMAMSVKWGVGAALGSGRQYIAWIHQEDWCEMVMHLLAHESASGPFNLVGPESVTQAEMVRVLAKTLRRPLWLPPVPAIILKALMGEMSMIALEGRRISARKIMDTGYVHRFPALEAALSDLF